MARDCVQRHAPADQIDLDHTDAGNGGGHRPALPGRFECQPGGALLGDVGKEGMPQDAAIGQAFGHGMHIDPAFPPLWRAKMELAAPGLRARHRLPASGDAGGQLKRVDVIADHDAPAHGLGRADAKDVVDLFAGERNGLAAVLVFDELQHCAGQQRHRGLDRLVAPMGRLVGGDLRGEVAGDAPIAIEPAGCVERGQCAVGHETAMFAASLDGQQAAHPLARGEHGVQAAPLRIGHPDRIDQRGVGERLSDDRRTRNTHRRFEALGQPAIAVLGVGFPDPVARCPGEIDQPFTFAFEFGGMAAGAEQFRCGTGQARQDGEGGGLQVARVRVEYAKGAHAFAPDHDRLAHVGAHACGAGHQGVMGEAVIGRGVGHPERLPAAQYVPAEGRRSQGDLGRGPADP